MTTSATRTVLFLLLLVLGAILIRAPFFAVPMVADEGGYAYVAKFWTSDFQLYRDIPFDRPQAIFFLYRLAFATLGSDTFAIRKLNWVSDSGVRVTRTTASIGGILSNVSAARRTLGSGSAAPVFGATWRWT